MRNLGQTNCLRCQRPHYGCVNAGCISDELWQELVAYAAFAGRAWKSELIDAWSAGSDTLRWARNIIGPSGLYKIKLDAPKYSRKLGGKLVCGRPTGTELVENWFDPYNHEHVKAWKHLCEQGSWPEGFIPDYVEMTSGWQIDLTNQLANAWIDHITNVEYINSIP